MNIFTTFPKKSFHDSHRTERQRESFVVGFGVALKVDFENYGQRQLQFSEDNSKAKAMDKE